MFTVENKIFLYLITTQRKHYKHFVYVLPVIFLTEIFTEVIVDSCAVVRNNTERSLVQFAPPPCKTVCSTISQPGY